MSLERRAATATSWSGLSQLVRQAALLLTTIVLAHLLAPSDFGLIAMASVVTGVANRAKDLGASAAIIQHANPSHRLMSSVFWVTAGFGVATGSLVFLSAPLVARFYGDMELVDVLRGLSAIFLVSGLAVIPQVLFERALNFRLIAKVEILATVIGSIVGVGAAVAGFGVWSLVLQAIAVSLLTVAGFWTATDWRPLWLVSWADMRGVSSYSANMVGCSLLAHFARTADYLLIGKALGPTALGYYALAYRVMLYPILNIAAVVGRVMFPLYSRIQDDHARFRRVYLRATGAIALVTFPIMGGVFAVAQPFVLVVFGREWSAAAPILMILAPVGLVQSIGTTVGAIYQAVGRADLLFRWTIASSLAMVAAFFTGLPWGIRGVAWAYLIAVSVIAYPSFSIPFRLVSLPVSDLVSVLWRSLVCAILMASGVVGVGVLLGDLSPVLQLVVLVPTGVIAYIGFTLLLNRDQFVSIGRVAVDLRQGAKS